MHLSMDARQSKDGHKLLEAGIHEAETTRKKRDKPVSIFNPNQASSHIENGDKSHPKITIVYSPYENGIERLGIIPISLYKGP